MPLTKDQKEAVTETLGYVTSAIGAIGTEPSARIGDLKDELEAIYEEMSEKAQASPKGEALQALIDDLEEVVDKLEELPDTLQEVEAALTELLEKK